MALVFDHSMLPLDYPDAATAARMSEDQMNSLRTRLSQYRVMLYSPSDDQAYVAPGEALAPRMGTQGIQGLVGIQGPRGLQGFVGNTGSQGSTGPQGAQGPTGAGASLTSTELANLLLTATNDDTALVSLVSAIANILKSGDWEYIQSSGTYKNNAVNSIFSNVIKNWIVPIGTIVPWVGKSNSLPQAYNGVKGTWKLCNGESLNITDYQELYNVIGTTYGQVSNGQFSLPDFYGRFLTMVGQPRKKSAANQNPSAISGEVSPGSLGYGGIGGESKHTLSTSELPSHVHSVDDYYIFDDADNNYPMSSGKIHAGNTASTHPKSLGPEQWTGGFYWWYKTHDTKSAGSGSAHENRPPYACVNWIIRCK